jgi:hypothetical protein
VFRLGDHRRHFSFGSGELRTTPHASRASRVSVATCQSGTALLATRVEGWHASAHVPRTLSWGNNSPRGVGTARKKRGSLER